MVRRPQNSAVPQNDSNSAPLDSNAIVDYLAGGLNTITSSINTPRGDSPYMRNVLIDSTGNVKSRSGMRYQYRFSENERAGGVLLVPFTAKNGLSFTFVKISSAAYFFQNRVDKQAVYSDEDLNFFTQQRLYFAGAFADNVKRLTPDHVVINEEDIRILLTFGVAAPVQFRVTEAQTIKTEAANYTTTQFAGKEFEFATASLVILYINGAFVSVSGVSYSAGVLTVTHPTIAAGTYTHDLMYVTWQWICEGLLLQGSDLYGDAPRFRATLRDLMVPVPVELLKNLEPLTSNRYMWPILVYRNEDRANYGTYYVSRLPDDPNRWSWSNGQIYDPAGTTPITPGFTHVTFGGNHGGDARGNNFARALKIPFAGDKVSYENTNEQVFVFVDGQPVTFYTNNSSTDDVGLAAHLRILPSPPQNFYSDSSFATGGQYKFISWTAAPQIGLDYNAVVEVIYPYIDSTFVGSNATKFFDTKPRNGYAFPLFGIHEHANYATGSFPRTCHIYQGRLALGGFPADPNKVVLSEVAGTAPGGGKYIDVGNKFSNLLNTDPLSLTITSSEDGAQITALSSAVGSLIIFTLGNTYRISGGGGSPISPINVQLSGIAAVGCCNPRSLIQVANSVTFLSLSGVYRLSPALQVGDFDIALISIKVNNLLQQANNINVAWMFYDDIENIIYLGFTDQPDSRIANRMLVYYVQWEAWSEYTIFHGMWTCAGGASVRLNKSYQVFHFYLDSTTSDNQLSYQLTLGAENQLNDFYFDTSDWANIITTEFDRLPLVIDTVTRTSDSKIIRLEKFRMLPFQEVRDAYVTVNGVPTDNWRKLAEDQIELGDTIQIGDVIVASPKNDLGNSQFLMWQDNVIIPTTSLVVGSFLRVVPGVVPPAGRIARMGVSIPYAYSTSVFNRNTLVADKLHTDFFVLLDNQEFYQQYQENEINPTVPQPFSELQGRFRFPVRLALGRNIEGPVYDLGLSQGDNLEHITKFVLAEVDADGVTRQLYRFARIGMAMKGSADVVQAFIYNNDYGMFSISAYQFIASVVGSSKR